jgi:serine/threonine protein phosphatase PrpC
MLDNARGLWLVADGMGGRAGGDVASKLAVQWIHDHFQSPAFLGLPLASELGAESISLHLVSAIRDAGLAIRDAARTRPGLDGLGTTIVATAVSCLAPLQVVIVHVGDSRAYLFRDNMLCPLTRDHSLVEDLLAKGQIAPAEAASHPQRHILLRALGIEGQMEPDIHSVSIEPKDVIFLCTDGITKMLNEDQIADCLRVASQAPDEACELLIKEANALGGKDNSTAVVVRFW